VFLFAFAIRKKLLFLLLLLLLLLCETGFELRASCLQSR
jgi:hypothetical protein